MSKCFKPDEVVIQISSKIYKKQNDEMKTLSVAYSANEYSEEYTQNANFQS